MITFNRIGYMGRLGNQMFQMASTIGIARKLNYDVKFPSENFIKGSGYEYNGCDLIECFDIPEILITLRDFIQIISGYTEKEFTYNSELLNISDYTNINGYLQTEKYFIDIEDEIRKIFTFKANIRNIGDAVKIEDGSHVSLHIRRGDYLNSMDYHPVQDHDYFKNTMSEFSDDQKFYIFSDDIEWCKSKFIGDRFRFIETGSPYVDMYIMSKFKNHIIANSSFSWWGAWLSGRDSKVIAPKKWFGPAINNDTADIYCKNWIIK
jgi:hypothetical protein